MIEKWLTVAIGVLNLLLLGVGVYLANNLRRQLHLKIVDRNWSLTHVFGRSWRLRDLGSSSLSWARLHPRNDRSCMTE